MTCFERIRENRFILIMRRIGAEYVSDAAKALYEGGVRAYEVCFDPSDPDSVKNVQKSIETIKTLYGGSVSVGAGTVLSPDGVDAAAEAGAEFIVAPNTDPDVIGRTKERGLVSVPGAYTPTEIVNAYKAGGDLIKIFPILPDGEAYLKNVISPLSHIPFIVTGGIRPDTVKKFLDCGPVAVAAGASIITNADCASGEYEKITRLAKAHTEVCMQQ